MKILKCGLPREAEEAETTEHVLSVEEFTQVVKIL